MEVTSDGADVAVDGPFVVVENDDEPLCLLSDIVESLKRDAVCERGVTSHRNDVFLAPGEVARDRHSQGCRERRPRVAGPVAVVLTFSAEHEAVQAAGLANRIEAVKTAGQDLVDVSLMTDVEENSV